VTNAYHPAHVVALDAISRVPDLGQAAKLVAPVVASCLNPTNNISDQLYAISILGQLKAAPETSVPALASALKSTNLMAKVVSANLLGTFGTQATAAIPALANAALSDPDPYVRRVASNALNQIDPRSFPSPYGH
jgi:HEAT repeat protein